jgi:rhodanese-related sulfurtransferase
LPPVTEKKQLFKVLFGCLFIGLLSVAMGLGFNFLRASPLPLIPPFLLKPSYEAIAPERAQELAREAKLLFLDSRNRVRYKEAHLPRALNLPVGHFSALYGVMTPLFPAGGWIVIYGEGWGRPTERELAYLLGEAGEERIRILDGGFRAWTKKGYPVERR